MLVEVEDMEQRLETNKTLTSIYSERGSKLMEIYWVWGLLDWPTEGQI